MYIIALTVLLETYTLPWVPNYRESDEQIYRLDKLLVWIDKEKESQVSCDLKTDYWDVIKDEILWKREYFLISRDYRHPRITYNLRFETAYDLFEHISEGQRRGYCVWLVPQFLRY